MKIKSLKRKYSMTPTEEYNHLLNIHMSAAKKYLDQINANSHRELILRFTGERIKKYGCGLYPTYLFSNYRGQTVEVSYDYVLDHVTDQLIKHEDENIFNEPVILY